MLTPLESWCEDFPVSCLHVVLWSHDRPLAWWKIDYCLGCQTVIWPHFHFSFSSAAESYAFIKMGVICFEIHEVRLHTCQTLFFWHWQIHQHQALLKLFRNGDVQVKEWWNENERLGPGRAHSFHHYFWMHSVHTANCQTWTEACGGWRNVRLTHLLKNI